MAGLIIATKIFSKARMIEAAEKAADDALRSAHNIVTTERAYALAKAAGASNKIVDTRIAREVAAEAIDATVNLGSGWNRSLELANIAEFLTRTSRNQTRSISEKLDDLQNGLKPLLGAAFSDSSKISCQ